MIKVKGTVPAPLVGHHAYLITDVGTDRERFKVYNPWAAIPTTSPPRSGSRSTSSLAISGVTKFLIIYPKVERMTTNPGYGSACGGLLDVHCMIGWAPSADAEGDSSSTQHALMPETIELRAAREQECAPRLPHSRGRLVRTATRTALGYKVERKNEDDPTAR